MEALGFEGVRLASWGCGDDRSVGREWRRGMRVLVDGGVVIMSKQTMRQAARLAASQAQAARVRADRDRRLEKLVVV